MIINIGEHEVEIRATLHTLLVYEREFKDKPDRYPGITGDLIKDVFGKHQYQKDDETVLVFDYTQENWNEEVKALWAMVKTASDIKESKGDLAPNDRCPGFDEWHSKVFLESQVNLYDIANAVAKEAMEGFFHTGAAASE